MSVKEAPAPARGWRAVVARFRGKNVAAPARMQATTPAAETPAAAATNGHVKVVTSEAAETETAVKPETAAETQTAAEPETVAAEAAASQASEPETAVKPKKAAVKPEKAAAPRTAAAESASELPLASYDTLTVASLRARLRNLSPDQLTILIDYEKAHEGREEVIGMFERRILKIKAGETTSFQAVK